VSSYWTVILYSGSVGSKEKNTSSRQKVKNHGHAIALHFMHYNFCRIHQTLRITPAMAAGVSEKVWEISDIVALIH